MLKITIDGHRGSGKTTLARLLRRTLAIPVLEVGVLFRTLALYASNVRDPYGAFLRDVRAGRLRFDLYGSSAMAATRVYYNESPIDALLWSPCAEASLEFVTLERASRTFISEVVPRVITPPTRNIILLGREVGSQLVAKPDVRIRLDGDIRTFLRRKQDRAAVAARMGFTPWVATADVIPTDCVKPDMAIDTTVVTTASMGARATNLLRTGL